MIQVNPLASRPGFRVCCIPMDSSVSLDAVAPVVARPAPLSRLLAMRVVLAGGCAAAVAGGLFLGDPAVALAADPDLARLLRGMAALKGLIVAPAVAVVWWRLGHPLSVRLAAVYVGGAWMMAFASALIWQLTSLGLAALVFHGAGLAMLVAAFGDGREASARVR
jgi:hypothetical protein